MIELGLLEKFPDSHLFQATPSRTVFSEGSLKVKIYDAFESPARAQVLLFPSLINRPYILDLGRGRSLIAQQVRASYTVAEQGMALSRKANEYWTAQAAEALKYQQEAVKYGMGVADDVHKATFETAERAVR